MSFNKDTVLHLSDANNDDDVDIDDILVSEMEYNRKKNLFFISTHSFCHCDTQKKGTCICLKWIFAWWRRAVMVGESKKRKIKGKKWTKKKKKTLCTFLEIGPCINCFVIAYSKMIQWYSIKIFTVAINCNATRVAFLFFCLLSDVPKRVQGSLYECSGGRRATDCLSMTF